MSGSETASATGHAGRGASLLVAAPASAFGVVLLETTSVLATVVSGNDVSRLAAVPAALSIVAFLFITIAVYVCAIVTTNTVATVIAGRTRTIALMRLIGSSAGDQRRAVALDGLKVGLAGAVLAAAAGILLSFAGVRLAFGAGLIPERSARTTIGPVIAVTLITMFAVAGSTFETMMQALMDDSATRAAVSETVSTSLAAISVLVGFSALIAAVGMITNLALSVLQCSREIGLLRALGFTGRQVRAMILAESVQMTVAVVTLGLVLGVAYGWAAAQSLFGSVTHSGLVAPSIPWLLVTLCVVGTVVLTVGATILPARGAVSLAPIVALAAG
ncbi:ABC transporter permease [Cryobacterium sp. GrIS_2_6]|uniref:ABC transporter permease n=1 Tax=Cryobacterium sp. GrIS_2_6 TaxID=3162785 RepID=UPI002E013E90|nr:ABC-type antimicrobial peptide transport system permease subunit [Cryobacterium psychrotolerans]